MVSIMSVVSIMWTLVFSLSLSVSKNESVWVTLSRAYAVSVESTEMFLFSHPILD